MWNNNLKKRLSMMSRIITVLDSIQVCFFLSLSVSLSSCCSLSLPNSFYFIYRILKVIFLRKCIRTCRFISSLISQKLRCIRQELLSQERALVTESYWEEQIAIHACWWPTRSTFRKLASSIQICTDKKLKM